MESSIFGFRKNHDIYTSENRYFGYLSTQIKIINLGIELTSYVNGYL